MSQSQVWAAVQAILQGMGKRGIPHVVSTTQSFTAVDQPKEVIFKFADQAQTFIWTHALYASDNAAVAAGTDTVFGGALIDMSNVGSLGSFGNGEVMPISALFGRDGACGGAKELPTPVVFNGASIMRMSATNKVAGAHVMYLSLIGVRAI